MRCSGPFSFNRDLHNEPLPMPDSLIFTLLSFLVALAVLITVHEFGHFWVARRLGVRVLRFSIGFGQPLWRRTARDGTEYVIAAIPLGGYVKMLDEREAPVPEADLPYAFNRKSLWRRSAIVMAGPLFNFLFAILAYWGIYVTGDVGARPLVGAVDAGSPAEEVGFRPGDEILEVNGHRTPTWESVLFGLMAAQGEGSDVPVRVREADGHESVHYLDAKTLGRLGDDPDVMKQLGLEPARPELPPVIGKVMLGEPADEAGLRSGDRLLAADGTPLKTWKAWVDYVRARPGRPIQVKLERGGKILRVRIVPRALPTKEGTVGHIGAGVQVPEGLFERYRVEVRYGPWEALGQSLRKTWDLSATMLRVMGRMLTGQASLENLSGPISIAQTAGRAAHVGVGYFVKFLAVVSISLGVLNLFPIPVLDGGHLLFFLIEAVRGAPLSERAMEQGQRLGIALLVGLMFLAFYVDLNRLLG